MKHFSLLLIAALAAEKINTGSSIGSPRGSSRRYIIVLCLLLLLPFMSTTAVASHFKGGYITYTYAGGGQYHILTKGYWHKDEVGSIILRYEGTPKIDNSPRTVSKTLLPDGETVEHVQKQVVTWSKPGTYVAYWRTCCWDSGSNFNNNLAGVFATINYNPEVPSSSPRFTNFPFFNFTAGQPVSYRIGMEEPDGHEQEYTLVAPYNATADVYKELLESGFQLQKDGTILWENPIEGEWLVNVKLREKINGSFTGAYISWEIILHVGSAHGNRAPDFVPIQAKAVKVGGSLSFQIEASDAEGQVVKLTAYGTTFDQGATFTQTEQDRIAKGVFTWSPPQDAFGTYQVQFLATDNQAHALSSQLNVEITVVECNMFATNYSVLTNPCPGSSNGRISLGISEERFSPYQYSLDNGLTYQSSPDFENLVSGTYTGIVMDAIGCTSSPIAITLEEAPLPEVTLGLPAAVCADAGAVALTGGSPSGGVYQGSGVENGFFYPEEAGAGTHTIYYTYTDSNGCSNTASEELLVNETLIADAGDDVLVYYNSGSGAQNGGGTGYGSGNGKGKGKGAENGAGHDRSCATLTAGATGGTSPYTYAWSTGETSQTITVCPTETTTYLLTITDALECSATSQVQVMVEEVQGDKEEGTNKKSTTEPSTSMAALQAFPNPLTDDSQLTVTMKEADQITVEIIDPSGTVVKRLYTGHMKANETRSFSLNSKLGKKNLYIARVTGTKGVYHLRLMMK